MITFVNPLEIVIRAYQNIYGNDKTILIQFNPKIRKRLWFGYWGETEFLEDSKIIISISPYLSIEHTIEIIAHELAHVAAGISNQHNNIWDNCFGRIQVHYDLIFKKLIEAGKK